MRIFFTNQSLFPRFNEKQRNKQQTNWQNKKKITVISSESSLQSLPIFIYIIFFYPIGYLGLDCHSQVQYTIQVVDGIWLYGDIYQSRFHSRKINLCELCMTLTKQHFRFSLKFNLGNWPPSTQETSGKQGSNFKTAWTTPLGKIIWSSISCSWSILPGISK